MVDFHTHSRYSDGSDTPAVLCRKAARRGLRALALTDHDTTAGLSSFFNACRHEKIEGIAGLELEIRCQSGQFHLLAFGFDPENIDLQKMLEQIRGFREERNQAMLTRISRDITPMTLEEIQAVFKIAVIGRPHIAAMLVKKKKVQSIKEAFDRYLGSDRPYYYSMKKTDFSAAAAIIHAAGGITVLAHPHTLGLDQESLRYFCASHKEMGLDGIEVFHPDSTLEWSDYLKSLATELDLAVSGGSDYHGKRRNRKIGNGPEKMPIDDQYYYSLTEKMRSYLSLSAEKP
jgi:predicted metal-dependent phosphoesterase TrpH